jgi:hypothetical protein
VNSKKSHEGWLMVDHRASPGLPADFYQQQGVDLPTVGEGKVLEMATLTCSHCRSVQIINPFRTRERPYCRKCDHYICDACSLIARQPEYVHTPFEKRVDDLQKSTSGSTILLSQLTAKDA